MKKAFLYSVVGSVATSAAAHVGCEECEGCLWDYGAGLACYPTWDETTCNRYAANSYYWCGSSEGNEKPVAPGGEGNDDTTTPAASPDCVDIQAGCQKHWCTDEHWKSQCRATCGGCNPFSGGEDTTSKPIVVPVVTTTTSKPVVPVVTTGQPSVVTTTSTATPTTTTTTTAPTDTATPTTTTSPSTNTGGPSNGKKFVMYYPAWATYARNSQVADIDASKLTHINYGFVNIQGGECVLGDAYADTEKFFAATDSWNDPPGTLKGNFNQLLVLKEKYPHLVTMASIGGWTWSGQFHDVAKTEEGRTKFAESCAGFMKQYGFDGLDVDWEFPVIGGMAGNGQGPEDKENFTLLLRALRRAMDAVSEEGVHHPLTIASAPNPDNINLSYDIPAINEILDFINVMTYDYNGAWTSVTGHNAPLYANPNAADPHFNVANAVQKHLEAGVSKEKLIMGLPFYGRGWSNVIQTSQSPNGLFDSAKGPSPGTWEAGVLDYSDLVENYVNKNGYTRYWDDVSKVPYLFNSEKNIFISYDDEQSICYKVGYINLNDLGGAMVWEETQDYQKQLQTLAYDVVIGGADACNLSELP